MSTLEKRTDEAIANSRAACTAAVMAGATLALGTEIRTNLEARCHVYEATRLLPREALERVTSLERVTALLVKRTAEHVVKGIVT